MRSRRRSPAASPTTRCSATTCSKGIFARAGLASDVEVVEDFPSRYDVDAQRQHRWTRGDWQLLPWILGHWRAGRARARDSAAGRWPTTCAARWSRRRCWRRSRCAVLPLPGRAIGAAVLAIARDLRAADLPAGWSSRCCRVPSASRCATTWRRFVADTRGASLAVRAVHARFSPTRSWRMGDAIVRTAGAPARHAQPPARMDDGRAVRAGAATRRRSASIAQMAGGTALAWRRAIGRGLGVRRPPGRSLAAFARSWLARTGDRGAGSASRWRVERDARSTHADQQRLRADRAAHLALLRDLRHGRAITGCRPTISRKTRSRSSRAARRRPTSGSTCCRPSPRATSAGAAPSRPSSGSKRRWRRCAGCRNSRGHFFNWYGTEDLRALDPPYISSVDSGNLAGHLLTVANACDADRVDPRLVAGADRTRRSSLQLRHRRIARAAGRRTSAQSRLGRRAADDRDDAAAPAPRTRRSRRAAGILERARRALAVGGRRRAADARWPTCSGWIEAIRRAARRARARPRSAGARTTRPTAACDARPRRRATSRSTMDFAFLLRSASASCCRSAIRWPTTGSTRAATTCSPPRRGWPACSPSRRATCRPSTGSGSAAPRRRSATARRCISWSGSMFEYLMPSLVMRAPYGSLLEQTNRLVVERQRALRRIARHSRGASRSRPTTRATSSSPTSTRTSACPGLGLKRGLADNVVIAPYATGLATMVDARAALAELRPRSRRSAAAAATATTTRSTSRARACRRANGRGRAQLHGAPPGHDDRRDRQRAARRRDARRASIASR